MMRNFRGGGFEIRKTPKAWKLGLTPSGHFLKEARQDAGVTQEELATAIHTKKSVISRLENQASDARVSTLRKVAQALGKELVIELREPGSKPKRRKATRKQMAPA